jgi:hypothetical protein
MDGCLTVFLGPIIRRISDGSDELSFGRVPLNPWLNIGHDIHAEYVMIMLSLFFATTAIYGAHARVHDELIPAAGSGCGVLPPSHKDCSYSF